MQNSLGVTIAVIQRFLEVQEDALTIAASKNWQIPSKDDLQFLRVVHTIMKVFVEIFRRLQTEKDVSLSSCYGYLKAAYKSLDKSQMDPAAMESAKILRLIMNSRFDRVMNSQSADYDPIYFIATALDSNNACRLSAVDSKSALCAIQNLVQVEPEPSGTVAVLSTRSINETLDQLLAETLEEQQFARKHKDPTGAKSWLQQVLSRVVSVNPNGKSKIDALKYCKNLLEARPIAILAIEVLSIPAISSLIEKIFSQAGLSTNSHRNRTSFDLLNSQLIVYCNYFVEDVNLF